MITDLKIDYIYSLIPSKYVITYHNILMLLADYGEDMLKDCKANCKDRNSNVIECYNMFNSAIASYNLGNTKLADTIVKYINGKLKQLGINFKDNIILNIDAEGHIKVFVNSDDTDDVKFYINEEDLHLYLDYIEDLKEFNNINLENGHLVNYGNT